MIANNIDMMFTVL